LAVGCISQIHAGLLGGPFKPYHTTSDGPFNVLAPPFTYGFVETFESLPVNSTTLSVPGVTASAGFVVTGSLVDSVEPLGNPTAGHSFFSGNGAAGTIFTFDATALGGHLPTDVGIVWTDGDGPNRTFEAWDASNNLIGTVIDSTGLFFSSGGDGDQANYRLFTASDTAGISRIFIANDNGGIEVDDLQYGHRASNVPDQGGLTLFGIALASLAGFARWQRRIIA